LRGTDWICIIQVNFRVYGGAMAQRSVASLSPRRLVFDHRSVHVEFVMDKWHRHSVFWQYFCSSLWISFRQWSILIFNLIPLRSLGTFRKAVLFRKSGRIGSKSTFTFCFCL